MATWIPDGSKIGLLIRVDTEKIELHKSAAWHMIRINLPASESLQPLKQPHNEVILLQEHTDDIKVEMAPRDIP